VSVLVAAALEERVALGGVVAVLEVVVDSQPRVPLALSPAVAGTVVAVETAAVAALPRTKGCQRTQGKPWTEIPVVAVVGTAVVAGFVAVGIVAAAAAVVAAAIVVVVAVVGTAVVAFVAASVVVVAVAAVAVVAAIAVAVAGTVGIAAAAFAAAVLGSMFVAVQHSLADHKPHLIAPDRQLFGVAGRQPTERWQGLRTPLAGWQALW